jgi:hypothetical protein
MNWWPRLTRLIGLCKGFRSFRKIGVKRKILSSFQKTRRLKNQRKTFVTLEKQPSPFQTLQRKVTWIQKWHLDTTFSINRRRGFWSLQISPTPPFQNHANMAHVPLLPTSATIHTILEDNVNTKI